MTAPWAMVCTFMCILTAGVIAFSWLANNPAPGADRGHMSNLISKDTKLGFPESVTNPSRIVIVDSWARPGFKVSILGEGLGSVVELVKTDAGWVLNKPDGGIEVLE